MTSHLIRTVIQKLRMICDIMLRPFPALRILMHSTTRECASVPLKVRSARLDNGRLGNGRLNNLR